MHIIKLIFFSCKNNTPIKNMPQQSSVTCRSQERTIAMLRRKLKNTETCLNETRLRVIEILHFVDDTDVNDREDVLLSNNFVIRKSNEILAMVPENYNDYSDDDTENDTELDSDYNEMSDLEDEMPDLEDENCIFNYDFTYLNHQTSRFENIDIDGVHHYHDKYGDVTGRANLLLVFDSNQDLEPVGIYIPNVDI